MYSHTSLFPSLGIPKLDLEYPCWNTYVEHWNSNVGIPMSNIHSNHKNHQIWKKSGGEMKKPMWVTPIGILGWSLDNGPGLFT